MPQRIAAYLLYELVMTLAVVAIVLTIGLPSFSGMVARSHQRVEIDALFHAIHLARKESIVRRRVVSLCPSFDGRSCAPGRDWSGGWLMFVNGDRDEPPRIDPGETILTRHRAGGSVRIMANRRGFSLRSTQQRATNGTIVVCDKAGRTRPKALVISYTGRPRVALETSDGDAYSCAH
jgi:type IV fimbrial biogenesis protein FimT